MSHNINSIAYTNERPWHGLGNHLSANQPIETWLDEAGMNWQINETPVLFSASHPAIGPSSIRPNPHAKVLYRSDNLEPLSVVSPRYKVVQPKEILEFYRDLVAAGHFEIETAGVLKHGRKLWALAKTGQEVWLKGGDQVKNYLLLATSCDGSLATTAKFTSIRVVCNNTLQVALDGTAGTIKIPHSREFDAQAVKNELGLGITAWDRFKTEMNWLSQRQVNKFDAMTYFVNVLGDPDLPLSEQPNQKALENVHALFNGQGLGSTMTSAQNTVWGLLNAVTEHIDHRRRSINQDYRLDSAWFGIGSQIKQKALEEAVKLLA